MKYHQSKLTNAQYQKDPLWQPLSSEQSQTISGGVLLFANPFAGVKPPIKDFGYSFPCDGPGRGGTC
jgi:hypothetical protein